MSVEVKDVRLGPKVALNGVTLHLKADGWVQVAAILAEITKLRKVVMIARLVIAVNSSNQLTRLAIATLILQAQVDIFEGYAKEGAVQSEEYVL